jgi:anaerobic selenocysteine-containing dehydrogenase
MMTIRSHDQFNTTIYGLDDRYRGIHGGRRVIFMNRNDIAQAGLKERQLVDLTSHFQGERRTIRDFSVIPYEIPRRCTATYYPETNPLVALGSVAEISNTPASKSIDHDRTRAPGCRAATALIAARSASGGHCGFART